ncbi:MAG: T9SS type A sorting domain-containing protein, partial [Candidatus Woesearchaeota archaeon]
MQHQSLTLEQLVASSSPIKSLVADLRSAGFTSKEILDYLKEIDGNVLEEQYSTIQAINTVVNNGLSLNYHALANVPQHLQEYHFASNDYQTNNSINKLLATLYDNQETQTTQETHTPYLPSKPSAVFNGKTILTTAGKVLPDTIKKALFGTMVLGMLYAGSIDANAQQIPGGAGQQTTNYQSPDNPNSQITVNVLVKDNYTGQALDSAFAKLIRDNITLDSGYTNSSGNVLLRFIPVSNNDRQDELPKTFGLSPAYPNPADKNVNALIAVPSSGTLEYALYDVLGKKVFDGKQEVLPGNYQLSLHQLDLLSQGVYFLQAKHNDQQVVVKLAKVGNSYALSSGNLEASLQTAQEFLPLYKGASTSMHKEHLLNNIVLSVSKPSYASATQNHTITRDTSLTVGLVRQNQVALANLYPNGQPVANAKVLVN